MNEQTEQTLYFVSCVGQKRNRKSRARYLYTSTWFQKAREFVEQTRSPWFILSAMHGIVSPEDEIEPYEKTLNTMPIIERREWASNVLQQFDGRTLTPKTVVFLAGQRYREGVADVLAQRGIAIEVPMEGLRIGEQLGWLSRNAPPG
ncbi:DUF6884 domain-containing protein [Thalassoglobus polymorphus]|uniref:DUF6884 domain-containing protein n=1 Tax=Thalassoglobus polymorphus TaxID=2527994 RepID=A0A517QUK7_9PLAN|nr:DUF6884 domain-containing protein [Thalassoglobus polymorphus]QDT35267.1 hypothetical protein Mal48_45430 [Thalassoglobus polymorphus]